MGSGNKAEAARCWQQFTATKLLDFGLDGRWPQGGHLPSAFFPGASPTCPARRSAICETEGRRQFHAMQLRLKVEPLAEEIAELIENRQ